ncbi:TPA_asm: hypothetical protein [Triaenorhabdovirus 2]|nr:TPA_asm: hypothetical protein [Triaenorhabdovirus 2]
MNALRRNQDPLHHKYQIDHIYKPFIKDPFTAFNRYTIFLIYFSIFVQL